MKYMMRRTGFLVLILLVSGCTPPESGDTESSAQSDTVFDPAVQTLERAESVEALSRDRKSQLDKKLEESGD
jgi:hypothetical protein